MKKIWSAHQSPFASPVPRKKRSNPWSNHVLKARTLRNALFLKRGFCLFCQLEYSFILFFSSWRIIIVFKFRKIRQCHVKTENLVIRFYLKQVANFLQQLGYITFELIFIGMKENLVFAGCKILSVKFQFAEGIVWFFWIRKLWCFRNVKRSKGSCIRVGKPSKIDIFQKMFCWKYGHLWLVTSKDEFFSDLGQRAKEAPMILFFCCWKML